MRFVLGVSLVVCGVVGCTSDPPTEQPTDELPLVEPAGGASGSGAGSPGGASGHGAGSSLAGGAAGSPLAGSGGLGPAGSSQGGAPGGSHAGGSGAQGGSGNGPQGGSGNGPQGGSAQGGTSAGGSGNGPQGGSAQAGSGNGGSGAQGGSGNGPQGGSGNGPQGGSGNGPQGGSGNAAGAPACPPDTSLCGANCRFLTSDPANCGACGKVCPVPPGGQASCTNSVCSVVCGAGTTACGDGCHSLQDDPQNCGACGKVCPGIPGGQGECSGGVCSAGCSAGYQMIGNQCAIFAGFYSVDTTGDCGGCTTPNPLTGDCSCPAGFVPTSLQSSSSCYSSQLVVCGPQGTPAGDYAGVFQVLVTGDGTSCAGNPFSAGDCSCPADATPVTLQTLTGTFSVCVRTGAPISTFGGVFQQDSSCRAPNPRTNDCTCPAGTSPRVFPAILFEIDTVVPTSISFCMP